ncbi:hypothetical protein OOU_Y34scaffold00255g74 [Pyricularia oryzae Y34]|uniref:Uncharacterized protein n=1 Tax=Pyricularia oryzae (strain Y34) TaxID=1143189 RepID=A0AA97PP02_PYRO3|nr:hypothetical protein OOU_Y34scaffold00255g74 [Pyricularia oryzae Y34]
MYREKGLALLKCSVDGHSLGYLGQKSECHNHICLNSPRR